MPYSVQVHEYRSDDRHVDLESPYFQVTLGNAGCIVRDYVKYNDEGQAVAYSTVVGFKTVGKSVTGKPWVRWKWIPTRVYRRLEGGRFVLLVRGEKVSYCRRVYRTPDYVERYLGQPRPFYEVYPLCKLIDLLDTSSEFLRNFEDVADAASLTRNLFGKKRMRKDLVKAVARCDDPLLLEVVWSLRDPKVPTDWLITALNHDIGTVGRAGFKKTIRPHVRNLDKKSKRRLLFTLKDARTSMIVDISRMLPDARITSVSSWEDLHNKTAAHHNAVLLAKAEVDRVKADRRREARQARRNAWLETPEGQAWKLEQEEKKRRDEEERRLRLGQRLERYEELAKKLSGKAGGYRIKVAKDRSTLIEWGAEMSNCISGYDSRMREARSLLFGVYEGGKLIANGEIIPERNELVQLLGPHNSRLTEKVRQPVITKAESLGVKKLDGGWGL